MPLLPERGHANDLFASVVRTKIFRHNVLPSLPKTNSRFKSYENIIVSYDLIPEFVQYLKKCNNPIELTIFDEDDAYDQINLMERFNLLQVLSNYKAPIISIRFNLSDRMFRIYNHFMNVLNWKYLDKTKINISLDRHFGELNARECRFSKARGTLLLPEEKLIWLPHGELLKLNGIVSKERIKNTLGLQNVINDFLRYLRVNYGIIPDKINNVDPFMIIQIAYEFVRKNVRYAYSATRINEEGNRMSYNLNQEYDWASEPYGTYMHHQGICTGQARLMAILLNNPYIRLKSFPVHGRLYYDKRNLRRVEGHRWVGSVINGKLYYTCTTMKGPFLNPEGHNGFYIYAADGINPFDESYNDLDYDTATGLEKYPRVFPLAYLSENEKARIRTRVQNLKKSDN